MARFAGFHCEVCWRVWRVDAQPVFPHCCWCGGFCEGREFCGDVCEWLFGAWVEGEEDGFGRGLTVGRRLERAKWLGGRDDSEGA